MTRNSGRRFRATRKVASESVSSTTMPNHLPASRVYSGQDIIDGMCNAALQECSFHGGTSFGRGIEEFGLRQHDRPFDLKLLRQ